jgi:hypothetical protein
MPWVGFQPTIPALGLAKTFHALDYATTVIGSQKWKCNIIVKNANVECSETGIVRDVDVSILVLFVMSGNRSQLRSSRVSCGEQLFYRLARLKAAVLLITSSSDLIATHSVCDSHCSMPGHTGKFRAFLLSSGRNCVQQKVKIILALWLRRKMSPTISVLNIVVSQAKGVFSVR